MPPDLTAWRVLAAERWGISLIEPLFSPKKHADIEHEYRRVLATDPDWWLVHASGLASDVGQTLPIDDRFRSVVIEPDGVARWPDGSIFGTWRDSLDVIDESSDAPTTDASFTAIEDDLAPAAAAIARTSIEPWRAVHSALSALRDSAGDDACFDAATSAIRFIEHRRRSYGLPADDIWPLVSCFTWTWRARRFVEGIPLDDDEIRLAVERERIPTE
jgi:hypothetical protein